MASPSPAGHGLSVEQVHSAELTSFGSESACESALSPREHAVPANAVVPVWMASAEEDALAAGEFVMVIIVFLTWCSVNLCALVQAAPCKRWSLRMHQRALPCLLAQSAHIALITNRI